LLFVFCPFPFILPSLSFILFAIASATADAFLDSADYIHLTQWCPVKLSVCDTQAGSLFGKAKWGQAGDAGSNWESPAVGRRTRVYSLPAAISEKLHPESLFVRAGIASAFS
jgi:hypothetical protein